MFFYEWIFILHEEVWKSYCSTQHATLPLWDISGNNPLELLGYINIFYLGYSSLYPGPLLAPAIWIDWT